MISKIVIRNFRSIRELHLKTHGLCGLVGPNSTGKTNVLKALNILLGDVYPTDRAFSREDFHKRDTSQEISITVNFTVPLAPEKLTLFGTSRKEICECVSMTLTHRMQEGATSTHFTCIGNCGQKFYGNGVVRDKVAFIYIPSDRALEKQLTVSKWTLLGKMLTKVDASFRNDPVRMAEFEDAMKAPQELLEVDFEAGVSYHKFKKALISRVISNTKGHADGCDLDLKIFDPLWYYKMIQITTLEDGERFNPEEIGSGMQNLILVSLFQAYADLMKDKAVLAIEEPELYLFPQAQRELFREFFSISARGGQVFYTTHSPRFVNVSRSENVVLLRKTEGETRKLNRGDLDLFLSTDDKVEINLLTKFDAEVNELFFADKIILVEGYTEKTVLKRILDKLDPTLRTHNFCVVNTTGKGSIPFFVKLLKFLGHADYLVLYDSDLDPDKNVDALNSAQKQTQAILDVVENPELNCLELNHDFESFCGYTSSKKDKLGPALRWVEAVNADDLPPEFGKLAHFIKATGIFRRHLGVQQVEITVVEERLATSAETIEADLLLSTGSVGGSGDSADSTVVQ